MEDPKQSIIHLAFVFQIKEENVTKTLKCSNFEAPLAIETFATFLDTSSPPLFGV